MQIQWHIGCSGFHYKHWKGIFYPNEVPQRLWFDYYSRYFNSLEFNVTFYRFPRLHQLQKWFDISPAGFSFSVKAPKAITHYKKLINCEQMLSDFYGTVQEGLREKAACILFQFPSLFRYSVEHLERIVVNLDPRFSNVVEFRHVSWWQQEVFEALGKYGITFSGMSHPDFPTNVITNTPVIYYRAHGVPDLYRSPYTTADLKEMIVGAMNTKVEKAFIYFNNDLDASAVRNAKELIGLTKHL